MYNNVQVNVAYSDFCKYRLDKYIAPNFLQLMQFLQFYSFFAL